MNVVGAPMRGRDQVPSIRLPLRKSTTRPLPLTLTLTLGLALANTASIRVRPPSTSAM